ncbi:GntR family transcriptional regulator [Nakamurella flavida]|uniref:GntR family transcriptional regulator n=1 Tax=Nakamurella flavida TaxID=363630 RepID=A0A938YGJ7_9ACTN|nr:GntR family transcriptional regulator [Nakamurella flavida]MBM9477290.1 GntR family transcriptional regulator [Nakamurella flavida]MDP9779746.1 DNA-binding GntR family transcriptional regulator [Nakamurella flavida]
MAPLVVDLDRSSPVPLYFQVAQQIEQAIASGALVPGDRLDNEISLADQFGLSRPTMRRAIQQLVAKGLLVRKRGVGTQVVHGQVTRPVELTSLFDDLNRSHQEPRTTVLANELVPAPAEVAVKLDVAPGTTVLHLRRLRFAGGEPLAIMANWLPEELAEVGHADLSVRGMYQVMRARGVHMRVARQKIGARTATAEESRLLTEARHSPVLTMERITHDDSGKAVEWGRHAYRASLYSFEVTLVDP